MGLKWNCLVVKKVYILCEQLLFSSLLRTWILAVQWFGDLRRTSMNFDHLASPQFIESVALPVRKVPPTSLKVRWAYNVWFSPTIFCSRKTSPVTIPILSFLTLCARKVFHLWLKKNSLQYFNLRLGLHYGTSGNTKNCSDRGNERA